jgi:hypothetical protein
MSRRGRYIWLGVIGAVSAFLAWGAWHVPPGVDEDNQGGFVFVLLVLLILLFIYVAAASRAINTWIDRRNARRRRPRDPL